MSLPRDHDVAIIGMAARLPGADNIDEFWQNLCAGRVALDWRTEAELRELGVEESLLTSGSYVAASYCAAALDEFEPGFFEITQREADIRDPQHRLFLELANTALEHAGYDYGRVPGRVGVFGGAAPGTYHETNVFKNAAVVRAVGNFTVTVGNQVDYIAPFVSYKLGFTGPSVSVYTACSTALVAVHLACQSLRSAECEMALAGGVQVSLPLGAGYKHSDGSIYSADGHVRPFDAQASGTVFSSGGGIVLLKRLVDAVRDRDTVHAIIRGSAVNNDGGDRAGFVAPGVAGQRELIRQALRDAEVSARTIGFLEAHGTGTVVGDPIEIKAVSEAYAQDTNARGYCALASLKGNVGHLGPAAGIAGLIKATYAVREQQLPASTNCTVLNPRLALHETPFRLQAGTAAWVTDDDTPLRAGVSSFGIGGTNAHVIVERAPAAAGQPADADETAAGEPQPRIPRVLPLSARSPEALSRMASDLADHLAARRPRLADVAGTLQEGRKQHDRRTAIVAGTVAEAIAALRRTGDSALTVTGRGGRQRQVAFLLPGQGAQYPGMGAGLYQSQPVYRDALDHCAAVLADILGIDVLALLSADTRDARAADVLAQTRVTQPVTFAVEWALATLWQSWNIGPVAMLGHSVGEYAAAAIAGVMTPDDALRLLAARGALMQELPPGTMLALPLDAQAVRPILADPILDGEVSLAAANSPSACVVSGTTTAIDRLRDMVALAGVRAVPLRTSHAYHSHMMDPVLGRFGELIASVQLAPPQIPYLSNVTGDWIKPAQATDPQYWVTHLRHEVRFADGLDALLRHGDLALLEVGPGRALSGFAQECAKLTDKQAVCVQSLRAAGQEVADAAFIMASAGRLWANGVTTHWNLLRGGQPFSRVPLPTYPYERHRCWVSPDPGRAWERRSADIESEGTRPPLQAPLYVPVWAEEPQPRPAAGPCYGQTWLVVTSHGPAGAALIDACRATGAFIISAQPGTGFAAELDGYVVDPDDPVSMRDLLEAVWAAGHIPGRLLYAVGALGTPGGPPPGIAQQTYGRLLSLAQALTRVDPDGLDLLVVTDRAQHVTGSENVVPYAATARGPITAMQTEIPGVRVRHLDVQSTDEPGRLLRAIVREQVHDGDDLVAIRGARRWVRGVADFRPIANEAADRLPLRDNGVYLITGGLGGIGLEIARDLAARCRARLVLVGRRSMPDPADWDAVLADPDADSVLSRRIAAVRELEALGAQVLAAAADVADEQAMAAVVQSARQQFGPVNGVFHAAGLPGGALMEIHSPEAAAPVLRPKTIGTVVLDRLCGDEADFFVMFSSVLTVTGQYAHSDYVAANSFLDAYAAYRGSSKYVAINWAGWSEVGMVASQNLSKGLRDLVLADSVPFHHPLVHRRRRDESAPPGYFSVLQPGSHWVLKEHLLNDTEVLPGTALLEMVRAAAADCTGADQITLSEVVFIDPLAVTAATQVALQFTPDGQGAWAFEVTAVATHGGTSRVHCTGRADVYAGPPPGPVDLAAARDGMSQWRQEDSDGTNGGVMTFGPHWGVIAAYYASTEGRAVAEMSLSEEQQADSAGLDLHPSLLDLATGFGRRNDGSTYLPFTYRAVHILRPIPAHCWAVQQHRVYADQPEFHDVDVTVTDADGRPCILVEGYTLRQMRETPKLEPAQPREPSLNPSSSLRTVEGLEILRRILATQPGSQVVVCPGGLLTQMARAPSVSTAELGQAQAAVPGQASERTLDTPYIAPETPMQELLCRMWGEVLGIGQLGIDDDFYELGGSSLSAVQLAARMTDRLALRLTVTDLFNHKTVRSLAARVEAARQVSAATP